MKVAVLSGKGGTGKTFVTTNLAYVSDNSQYIDCDVEEPNGYLFLKPNINDTENVYVSVPVIDHEKCNGCRECVDFCKFNALAFVKDKVKVFRELCHSCGGCVALCPTKAIYEEDKEVGSIKMGEGKGVDTKTGIMNIGEASGVPIINRLLEGMDSQKNIFIDCPPGSSCLVMESVKDADFCVLVTEPTIYGVHNTKMVYELVKLFNKPMGLILNKATDNSNVVNEFCSETGLNVLYEFPYDANIAKMTSDGELLAEKSEEYNMVFKEILKKISSEVGR